MKKHHRIAVHYVASLAIFFAVIINSCIIAAAVEPSAMASRDDHLMMMKKKASYDGGHQHHQHHHHRRMLQQQLMEQQEEGGASNDNVNDYNGIYRDPPKPLTYNVFLIPPLAPPAESDDIRADSHEVVVVIRDPNTNTHSHQTLDLPNPPDSAHGPAPALSAMDPHN